MEKGDQAIKQLRIETDCNEKNIRLMKCDLRSFKSVRQFVQLYDEENKFDILICNAGIVWAPNLITKDGINTVIQVNYLSHFLLANLLLDKLKQCRPSRIVFVASGSHRSMLIFERIFVKIKSLI
jgi:NAD(P)-dependent dehydrogenase (short-subunit alcohol dehydrogenase family)